VLTRFGIVPALVSKRRLPGTGSPSLVGARWTEAHEVATWPQAHELAAGLSVAAGLQPVLSG